MPRDTHVLRFKVVSVECSALPAGQQYTITYHRGDTNRSTPCYAAHNGVINFAAMPEGAAVVHFKSSRNGISRFAPKYIRFMVEEYTRGMPRRLVGETEVDCTQVLKGQTTSGSGIVSVVFRLYGTTAKITVAVLVYPEHAPPLTFDGLIDASYAALPSRPPSVKVMTRGEAMMILMGLEALLERRRSVDTEGKKGTQSREEKQLVELEERRKALVGAEGLATEAIKARCEEIVAIQYTALARKHRNNFIGQTAAYLREMAIRSGEDFGLDDSGATDNTAQEQLARVNGSIEEAQGKVKKLEEEQTALLRIQGRVDVTAEVNANREKMAAQQQKLQLLSQSRIALTEAVQKQAVRMETPLAREVAVINARIASAKAEQQKLAPSIQHMIAVGASHAVKWARSKNPPEPDLSRRNKADGLFSGGAADDLLRDAGGPPKSKEQTMLDDVQRRQVVEALRGLKASAPPPTPGSPQSNSSSSGHRTPRDLFADAGLPSRGDFGSEKRKSSAEEEAAMGARKPSDTREAARHEDPMRPSGLGSDMFSAKPAAAPASHATAAGLPSMNDFMQPSTATRVPEAGAMFDFGALQRVGGAAASQTDNSGGGAAFELEPQGSARPMGGFATAPSMERPAYNKKDDPYYDEMDDFTVAPDPNEGNPYGSVEIMGGFAGFGGDTSATRPAPAAGLSAGSAPPRPTFEFGSGSAGDDTFGAPATMSSALGAGRGFSFGGGAADEPPFQMAPGSGNAYTGIQNLPTYNFGS